MQTRSIAVLISGNGSNLQAILDACQSGDIDGKVVRVISNRADAYGLVRAADAGVSSSIVPALAGESRGDYDARLQAELDTCGAEVVVLAGFMRILSDEFVNRYAGKMLNIHPSLLPKYTGLHTHKRVLEAGDEEHGCSVHFVTPELDCGPVILQAKVPVFEDDNVDELTARVHAQEHRIYPLVVKWFCQGRLAMADGKALFDNEVLPTKGYASED